MTLHEAALATIERIGRSIEANSELPTTDFDYEAAAIASIAKQTGFSEGAIQGEIWDIERANDGPYGKII